MPLTQPRTIETPDLEFCMVQCQAEEGREIELIILWVMTSLKSAV